MRGQRHGEERKLCLSLRDRRRGSRELCQRLSGNNSIGDSGSTYALVIDDFDNGGKPPGVWAGDEEDDPTDFYQSPLGNFDIDIGH